jgi:hypothetical protein
MYFIFGVRNLKRARDQEEEEEEEADEDEKRRASKQAHPPPSKRKRKKVGFPWRRSKFDGVFWKTAPRPKKQKETSGRDLSSRLASGKSRVWTKPRAS